jgi:hypothetical protein
MGSGHPAGYGKFSPTRRSTVLAHRYAFEVTLGPIPADLELDHLCRNQACCNPAHLEPVTSKINNQRRAAQITHCPEGHPYDGANLRIRKNGRRACVLCARAATRRARLRRLAKSSVAA